MPTLFIVDYKQYVVDGDNYAGFSGYREKQKVLLSQADYMDWMLEAARYFTSKDKVILRIRQSEYKEPEDTDVKFQVENAKARLKDEEKREQVADLLREKAMLEKKLKKLKELA